MRRALPSSPDQMNVHELQTFELAGVGRTQERSRAQAQAVVWTSPDVPESMEPARDYLWGHVGVPLAPGKYRLQVSLYPTADRRSPHETIIEWGPAVSLFEAEITATPGDVSPSVPSDVSISRRGSAAGRPR